MAFSQGTQKTDILNRDGYRQKNHIAIFCDILWDIGINIAIYFEF
jgi:hypothetical protein